MLLMGRAGVVDSVEASPLLRLSRRVLDLGEGDPGEIVRGGLVLKNEGTAPLKFSILRSCGCTDLSPTDGVIAPGGKVDVSVGLELFKATGSERSTSLVVRTNDPKNREVRCTLVARSNSPFQVTPAYVDFGDVLHGSPVSSSATIAIEREQGVTKILTRLTNENFVVQSNSNTEVHVSHAKHLPAGRHSGSLQLFIKGDEKRVVRVPLQVNITVPLVSVPSSLVIRKDGTGRFRKVHWIVISNNGSAALGDLVALNAPKQFLIEKVSKIGDKRCRYSLVIAPGWEPPNRFTLELEDSASKERCDLVLVFSDLSQEP